MSATPTFGLSAFSRSIVVDEGFESLPPIRIVFIILTVLLGVVSNVVLSVRFIRRFRLIRNADAAKLQIAKAAVLAYFGNQIIHVLHYADNIYRPISYQEPEWLYRAYLLAPMEITFFFNWPMTVCGCAFITRMVSVQSGRLVIDRKYCWWMFLYVLMSLMTVMHYRIAPPNTYSAFVNFTIGGEGVLVAILVVVLAVCLSTVKEPKEATYARLPQEEDQSIDISSASINPSTSSSASNEFRLQQLHTTGSDGIHHRSSGAGLVEA